MRTSQYITGRRFQRYRVDWIWQICCSLLQSGFRRTERDSIHSEGHLLAEVRKLSVISTLLGSKLCLRLLIKLSYLNSTHVRSVSTSPRLISKTFSLRNKRYKEIRLSRHLHSSSYFQYIQEDWAVELDRVHEYLKAYFGHDRPTQLCMAPSEVPLVWLKSTICARYLIQNISRRWPRIFSAMKIQLSIPRK